MYYGDEMSQGKVVPESLSDPQISSWVGVSFGQTYDFNEALSGDVDTLQRAFVRGWVFALEMCPNAHMLVAWQIRLMREQAEELNYDEFVEVSIKMSDRIVNTTLKAVMAGTWEQD